MSTSIARRKVRVGGIHVKVHSKPRGEDDESRNIEP